MGQNINTIAMKQSVSLYKQSRFEKSFQKIIAFLDADLSQQDMIAIKQFLREEISENKQMLKNYLSWLYQQINKRLMRIDNLEKVFNLARQIYLPNQFVRTDYQRKICLLRRHFTKAVEYEQKKEFQKAIGQLKQFQRYFPNEHQNYADIGLLEKKMLNYRESEISYLKAVELKKEEKYFIQLLFLYQEMQEKQKLGKCIQELLQLSPNNLKYQSAYADFLFHSRKFKEAAQIYYKLIKINPNQTKMIDRFNDAVGITEDYEKGLSLNMHLVESFPNSSHFYYNVGLFYRDLKKRKQAIEYFKKGLSIEQNAKAWFYLGQIYQMEYMDEEMFESFEKSIRLNGKNSKVYECIGDYFSKNEFYLAESMQFYEEQVKYNDNNAQAYFDMGREQYNKGDILQSIYYYKKVVEIKPDQYESYLLLASSKSRIDLFEEAICNLEIAIALKPTKNYAYNLLGNAYAGLGKISKAIQTYKKSIELKPDDEMPYFSLGLLYFNEYQFQQAEKYLKKCISIKPSLALAFFLLSKIYLSRNEQKQAIQFLQKVIQDEPTNGLNFSQLASAYYEIYNYEKALENYKTAYKLNEKDRSSAYNVGVVLVLLNRPQQGLQWIMKVQKYFDHRIYHCGCGIALVKLQRYQEAIYRFYKIISKQPEYYEPYFHLGKALKLSQKQAEEHQNYAEFLQEKNINPVSCECRALFYHGLGDAATFFVYLNRALQLLKGQLLQNEREGKKQICKFMRCLIRDLACIIRDYEQLDLVIMLGVLNRDIGDSHKTKWCFDKVINMYKKQTINDNNYQQNKLKISQNEHSKTLHEIMLEIYEKELIKIQNTSLPYFLFLLEFLLQQLLKINQIQGLLFYKAIMSQQFIRQDVSISNLIYRMRQQKMENLRIILQDRLQDDSFTYIRKYGDHLVRCEMYIERLMMALAQQIELSSKQQDKTNFLEKFLQQMKLFIYQSQYTQISETFSTFIRKQMQNIYEQGLSSFQEILENVQNGNLRDKLQFAYREYWSKKLPVQIANLLSIQLFNYMSLQPNLLLHFEYFLESIIKGQSKIQGIFTELYHIVNKYSKIQFVYQSNFLQDKNIYTVNLESSVIYEDYEYQKQDESLKSLVSFSKSVEQKVSKDMIQPKKKINKKSIIELSEIQPYEQENLFQRELMKQDKTVQFVDLTLQPEATTSSRGSDRLETTQSQIFERLREE